MSVFNTLAAPGANGHTTRTQTIGCFWHTLAAYGGKRARRARFERTTGGSEESHLPGEDSPGLQAALMGAI
jgi:hypothetical protein